MLNPGFRRGFFFLFPGVAGRSQPGHGMLESRIPEVTPLV